MTRGKVWATVAFLLGIAVSVAANVAHTYHPGKHLLAEYARTHHGHVDGWRPEIGSQIGAAFYPLALLLTVELLSRVDWPAGWAWVAARFGGAGLVAVVSAIVSYRHMAGLLHAYGEDGLTSAIGPLAVDGLMVVASMALLAIGRAGAEREEMRADLPTLSPLVDPATITLDAPPFRAVSETGTDPSPIGDEAPADPFPETPADLETWLAGTVEEPGVPADEEPVPAVPVVPDPHHVAAVEAFGEQVRAGKVPSIRAIRQTLRVGQDRAQDVKAYLSVLANQ